MDIAWCSPCKLLDAWGGDGSSCKSREELNERAKIIDRVTVSIAVTALRLIIEVKKLEEISH